MSQKVSIWCIIVIVTELDTLGILIWSMRRSLLEGRSELVKLVELSADTPLNNHFTFYQISILVLYYYCYDLWAYHQGQVKRTLYSCQPIGVQNSSSSAQCWILMYFIQTTLHPIIIHPNSAALIHGVCDNRDGDNKEVLGSTGQQNKPDAQMHCIQSRCPMLELLRIFNEADPESFIILDILDITVSFFLSQFFFQPIFSKNGPCVYLGCRVDGQIEISKCFKLKVSLQLSKYSYFLNFMF